MRCTYHEGVSLPPDSSAHPERPRSEWGRFGEGATERAVLIALGRELGMRLRPRQLRLPDGGRTEVEGAAEDGPVVVQLVIKAGEFTSQHRNKVMADMFKLAWIGTAVSPDARRILCISSGALPAFRAGGWLRRAAADFAIELHASTMNSTT